MTNGLILCIETATTNCSVALAKDGHLLAVKEDNSKEYSHAERLHLYIEAILKEQDLRPKDLSAVAVSKGPGSYTGLRIGVSAAKGLCFSLGIPLISVSTLLSLARKAEGAAGEFVIPLLDARRMEVYTGGFTANMEEVFPIRAEILNENSFREYLDRGRVNFIGNAVEKFRGICEHPHAAFLDRLPSASEMWPVAWEKYNKKEFEDVAYFEPYYLKDFMPG